MVYIFRVEYYSAIKKNAVLPFMRTWMDPEVQEKQVREREIPCDFTYMWNLKKIKQMNKQNRNRPINTEQIGGCHGVVGARAM